jgi:RHS repeat-associated protein
MEKSRSRAIDATLATQGRRASLSVPGQPDVNYTFDEANRLSQINQNSSTVSFTFDSAGRRTTMTLPNGVTATYNYDDASQLTGLSYATAAGPLGNLTYAYDMAGRRVSVGGTLAQTNLPSPVSVTAYNANNQLTTWGTANLFYDANGNMTSDGTNSFVWNARNKLASMNFAANSFQYDPFGRRQAKTISGTTTNYLYDGVNVAQELSGTTPTANLLSGGVDEVFTRTDSSGTANFVTDALGSTLALTNGSGSTVASYTYDPFGNTTQTGTSTNSYQYTGRENDGAGTYFDRGRYYSPTVQRFISQDPIGVAGGINLYAYVSNNPVSFSDPFGHDKNPHSGPPPKLPTLRAPTEQEYNTCMQRAASTQDKSIWNGRVEQAVGGVTILAGVAIVALGGPALNEAFFNEGLEGAVDFAHAGGFAYFGLLGPLGIGSFTFGTGTADVANAYDQYSADTIHCAAAVPNIP